MPRPFKNEEERKAGQALAARTAHIGAGLRTSHEGWSKVSYATLKGLNTRFAEGLVA